MKPWPPSARPTGYPVVDISGKAGRRSSISEVRGIGNRDGPDVRVVIRRSRERCMQLRNRSVAAAAQAMRPRGGDGYRRTALGDRADPCRSPGHAIEHAFIASEIEVSRLSIVEADCQQRAGEIQVVTASVGVRKRAGNALVQPVVRVEEAVPRKRNVRELRDLRRRLA